MLNNYLKILSRSLLKYKVFSFVNISGLAIGITCFLLLSLFVIDELSFDNFHENSDRIYRIYVSTDINSEKSISSKSVSPLGETLLAEYPEVIDFTRLGQFTDPVFRYKNKAFKEWEIFAVDSSFFNVFSFKLIEGNPATALKEPFSLVLTESMEKKYFGTEDALGKILVADNNDNYIITGVMEDFPHNSHFSCDFLTSISTYPEYKTHGWIDQYYSTYIVLRQGTDPKAFESKLKNTVTKYVGPEAQRLLGITMEEFYSSGNKYDIKIQPLKSIYLNSKRDYGIDMNTEWGEVKTGDITYTYIISIIAIFILFIAIINFMNLSTAKSENRAKEVGIRKTLGSGKRKLVQQFILESITTAFISFLIALVMIEFLLPAFNQLTGKQIEFSLFSNLFTVPLLLSTTIIIGILAGSYPAFYLSSFAPAHVLKSDGSKRLKKGSLRSLLVIVQFTISIALIISTMLIMDQLEFLRNKNLGFNKEHLVTIYGVYNLKDKQQSFKNKLLQNPSVKSATISGEMFRAGIPGNGYIFNKQYGDVPILAQYIDADYDFLATYKIELTEGRYFQEDYSTDSTAVLVNESFIREHGLKNVVGKILSRLETNSINRQFRIIGVIKDFNYESLHKTIRPLAVHLNKPGQNSVLTVRLGSGNPVSTIESIKELWKEFTGENSFYFRFVESNLDRLYKHEEQTALVTGIFSLIAILLACMGLFALAAFETEKKVKEIGIRKVLGATIYEIVALLSKQFTRWVIIANVLAWPAAYLFMSNWLQDFAYRVNIDWWIFILSGVVALLIAVATVSYQAIKAAMANPIESMKYE